MGTGRASAWTGRPRAAVVGGVLSMLLLLAAGCGSAPSTEGDPVSSESGGGAVTLEQDEALASALRDLSARRDSARLADLTSFEWDTVHVFSEGATSKDIQASVGSPVLRDDRYYDAGNLLVFMQQGAVLRAISVVPDLLVTRSTNVFDDDIELVPHGPATPALLLLRKP